MSSSFDTSLTKISISTENAYSSRTNQGAQSQRNGTLPATRDSQELQPYRVTISEEALRKVGLIKDESQTNKTGAPAKNNSASAKDSSSTVNTQESRELESLKQTDREVRAHEQAHVMAGGSLVRSAASFGYATGSDGRLYAVSGEVSIDSSPVQDDPGATISKMMRVISAALAPAQPSGQDRAVASAASKTQVEAQQQVTQQQLEKMQGGQSTPTGTSETQKTDSKKKPEVPPNIFNKSTSVDNLPDKQKQSNFQTKHINIQA